MRHYGPEDLVGIVLTPKDTESDGLERKLGLFSVIIISLSAMIGSGLFVLPALAMLELGGGENPLGGIWLAYLVAAVLVIPGAVSKSELSTAMPTSGGSYVYVQKTFGPLVGTIAGLGLWANFMLKSAFALIGFKAYLWVIEDLLGMDIVIEAAAILLLGIIVGINILGVKRIKKIQIPIVMFSAAYLFALCAYALAYHDLDWGAVSSRDSFGSWEDVAATSAFVFVSYAGVTKIAAVGGEIKDPERNLPYGILLSLLFSCLLYVTVTLVMAAAVAIFFIVPWLDRSKVRSAIFRPLYRQFFWLLMIDVFVLGYMGAMPAEGTYLLIARVATFYYFIHFLVILPLLGKREKTLTVPLSITEPVLGGSPNPQMVKKRELG